MNLPMLHCSAGARPSQRDRTQMPPRHAPAHQQAAGHQGQAGQPQQRQSAAAASTTAQTPGAFLWKWVGCSLMALLLARTLWFLVNLPAHGAYQDGAPHLSFAQRAGFAPRQQVFYFYNEATGQVQWEDPGHVPYEEQDGRRFWFLPDGSKTFEDPGLGRYAWVEQYSPELQRAYFFNQETRESSWERPADLSWRRIVIEDD